MKPIFHQCVRNAVLALVLCMCAVNTFAQVAGASLSKSLMSLYQTYGVLSQFDGGLESQLRALAVTERATHQDLNEKSEILVKLGSTYYALAKYDEALLVLQLALDIRGVNQGQEDLIAGEVLLGQASVYTKLAQFDKALPRLQRALSITENINGPEHLNTAVVLNNLAEIYMGLAQYEEATPLVQRAVSILDKSFGPEYPLSVACYRNLALVYESLGQHDKALPMFERALTLSKKVFGALHPDTALSTLDLANAYRLRGDYAKAVPLHVSALSLSEQAFGPDHPNFAAALEGLANIYYDLSQYDRSIPLLQRAMSIRQSALGADHPRTALNLSNLAYVYHAVGQPGLAIAYAKAAVNSYQIQRQQIAQFGSTALQTYTGSVSQRYQNLADMLVEEGRLSEAEQVLDMLKEDEQFEFIRRSETVDPRRTRMAYTPTEAKWMGRYRQIADQLAALGTESIALQKQETLGLSEQQKVRQKTLVSDLKVAQKAFDAFLGEMQEGFARQSAVRTVEIEELSQKAMREQQDLIASLGSDVALLRYYITNDKVGMLLTTAGVSLAHSTTINAKELNRQIFSFRDMLLDRKSNPLAAAQALYTLLVAPMANDIEKAGAKTVMLSLDGALRYLPFAALHDGQRYLVERWRIPMYTSVTKNRLRDEVTPQWNAAGFGVTRQWRNFEALPAVKSELGNIVRAAGRGLRPGAVYLDDAFTAQRFKDSSASAFQLVHVASHFQFSAGGTEANSFLLLGDGQELTLADMRTNNYRFDNVDLLTLSACNTGLGGGRDANGREIEGFGVIAQQQGAKSVLATLWSVADQSTASLMANMYRIRQEQHLIKIEALRQAQLSLMAQPRYSHPFYWAPFILMGNWR